MPAKWAQRKHREHSGLITHTAGGLLEIGSSDIHSLDPRQRENLQDILTTIRAARKGETPAIEHRPTEVIDADVIEVDADVSARAES